MRVIAVSADNDNIDLVAGTRIFGAFIVGGAAAAGVAEVYDSLTVTGTPFMTVKALTGDMTSTGIWPTPHIVRTAISVDMTGAGAILHLLVD